jgi:type II secretion system protein I
MNRSHFNAEPTLSPALGRPNGAICSPFLPPSGGAEHTTRAKAGMNRGRNPRADQGLTLLEVMVALGIVAIVLVSIFRLQAQSIAMEQITRFHTLAPLLADQVVAAIELQAPDFPQADAGDFKDEFPGYTWAYETRDVEGFNDQSGRPLLKQIDIQIRFNGEEDLFTLRTYRLANTAS